MENGLADYSMADAADVARMTWVLQNYDAVSRTIDQNGGLAFSKYHNGADGTAAPLVTYSKRIDGVYYVIEAAADNAYKKLWVETAYIAKKGGTQASYVQAQEATSETSPASTPTNTISAPSEKSNQSVENSQFSGTSESRSGILNTNQNTN